MKVGTAALRERNLGRLLNILWCERTISRADIARVAELSRSTVSAIVSELLAMGLISELGAGDSRGGRRPILLGFNDDAHLLAGVDMGATHVAVAVANLGGTVKAWRDAAHPVRSDPAGTIALIRSQLEACLEEAGVAAADLVGIGIAVPSPVDPETGTVSATVMPAWQGHELVAEIHGAFGVPVYIDNDANLGALAELWWDDAHRARDLTYIKVATGIGAGHIFDGAIYRGGTGVAGELGHFAIDPNGPTCACGLNGCLVTFVGADALVRRAEEARPSRPDSALAEGVLDIDRIVGGALAGDPLALEIVERAGRYLGIAVASLINLLNPSVVVLGGGLTRAGERLMEPLRQMVARRAFGASLASAQIVTSQLGGQAIALGAATLVLQEALSNPSLFPVRRRPAAASG